MRPNKIILLGASVLAAFAVAGCGITDNDLPDTLINTTIADTSTAEITAAEITAAEITTADTSAPDTTAADVTATTTPAETTTEPVDTTAVTATTPVTTTTSAPVTTATPVTTAPTPDTTTPTAQYTVAFFDRDGNLLSTQRVEQGGDATAPSTPIYEGYEFSGWDKSLKNVAQDMTVTAQYRAVRNQIFIQCTSNSDGSLTYTLTVTGYVNFYGLELKLDFEPDVTYINSAVSADGGAANYTAANYLIFSYTAPSGGNVTQRTELFSVTVRGTGQPTDTAVRVYDVDIFDENFANERYGVSQIKYN